MSAAFAQQAPGSGAATTLEEVIVTGTRLALPALSSVSPVSIVSADTIQAHGSTNIEDLLNQLPQFTADQSSSLSQGGTGVANLNLRDLGSQRTLVLINGRRLMPGDPTLNGNGAADVNNIPVELIDRVEVLTGSASATYGADAVAGVVNFIMNDHFQGVKIDLDYGFNYHDNSQTNYFNGLLAAQGFAPTAASGARPDGDRKGFTITLGSDFADNKGNFTAFFSYHTQNAVQGNARDFNACTVGAVPGGFQCYGSPTTFPMAIAGNDGNTYQLAPDGSGFGPLYQLYNYGPDHYFQRPDTRYNGGYFAHYEVNDRVEAYSEFSFMHDETHAQYAPAAIYFGTGQAPDPVLGVPDGNYYVNCGTGFGTPGANPFLSANLYPQVCNPASALGQLLISSQQTINGNTLSQVTLSLRNAGGGARADDYEHTSYRVVLGARGDITDAIKFDVYGMQGISDYSTAHYNDFSISRISNSLLAVTDPATGQAICLANLGQIGAPGCVPYNVWSPTANSAAALSYIATTAYQSGETRERVFSGNITVDFSKFGAKLPAAKDGLVMNFGAESRHEQLVLNVDQAYIDGDIAGDGIVEPVNGGYGVWEVFTEGRLPLMQDAPFAKELSADFGYRYSNYTEGFDTSTYKFGLQWAPVDDLRVRGSLQRAVRAPNVQELYQPPHVQLDGSNDYCANGNVPFFTPAQCLNTNVSGTQYGTIVGNPSAQYNGLDGGNTKLQPETAVTTTLGLVITPTALPGFAATVDYYRIKIDNLIGPYGADFILSQCGLTGSPQFCSLVHRASNGTLWLSPAGYVIDTNVNSGSEKTSGVDLILRYTLHMGRYGDLRTDLTGTYVSSFEISPFGAGSYDCAGLYGPICGVPLPKWRHNLMLDWQTPVQGLDVSLTWRFLDSVKVEYTSAQLSDTGVDPTYGDIRLPSMSYFDLSGAYTWQNVTVRLGVNNLFDKDPPLVGSDEIGNGVFGENNTYPQLYDTLGRYVHLSISAKF